jgi:arginase family enzyme
LYCAARANRTPTTVTVPEEILEKMAKPAKPAPKKKPSRTSVGIFPFDLFGGSGAAAGAELVADALRELIADNRRERRSTRACAYRDCLHLHEFQFEKLADYQNWETKARSFLRSALSRNDLLLWISGNHLGVLPVYQELGAGETLVIQFDAHLDIYHHTDCTSELSHGNYLRHCQPLPSLVNVGHRELSLTQNQIRRFFTAHFGAEQLALNTDVVVEKLRRLAKQAGQVFLDLDCDVFDTAYFPALSSPQPFGLSPLLFLRVLDAVWSNNVVGLAISEFEPARDKDDRCLSLLIWLLEYVLLRYYEQPVVSGAASARR